MAAWRQGRNVDRCCDRDNATAIRARDWGSGPVGARVIEAIDRAGDGADIGGEDSGEGDYARSGGCSGQRGDIGAIGMIEGGGEGSGGSFGRVDEGGALGCPDGVELGTDG
jgi:hypothetical protein